MFRESVIVPRCENPKRIMIEDSKAHEDAQRQNADAVVVDFTSYELEIIYTIEEENYLLKTRQTFELHWNTLSLGEKVVTENAFFTRGDKPNNQTVSETCRIKFMNVR